MRLLTLASIISAAFTASALADINFGIVNSRLVTGSIEEDGSNPTLNERVFGADFGEIAPDFAEEPGFQIVPGSQPVGAHFGFNVLDHVRIWDGTFNSVSPSTMTLSYGPAIGGLTRDTTLPPAAEFVAGYDFTVEPSGEFHYHNDYVLNAPASDGLYLLTLELYTDLPGVGNSEPFFIIFNQNETPESAAEADGWVRSNLVPAPNGMWTLSPLIGAAMRRRRRSR